MDDGPICVLAVDMPPSFVDKIRHRTGSEVVEVAYPSLTVALLAQLTPDAVFAPLMGPDFDIVEVAERLEKLAFGGHLFAVTSPIPDADT
ncbi:MAG: hypothetical protein WBB85_21615, partial [Albidovulum sp.]